MKKVVGITLVIVMAVLVFGFAGLVYAQGSTPTQPVPGQGMGGGRRGAQAGMGAQMGAPGGAGMAASGTLHTAMIASLAEALGMQPEALQARLDAGETLWQVAEGLGWTSDQLQAEMQNARSAALQQAVADGTLTQEQADWMAGRMNQGWPEGFGPGSANCDGSGQVNPDGQGLSRGTGRGQGMHRNNQVTP